MCAEQVEANDVPGNAPEPLRRVIWETMVRSGGAISFAEFMALALYHPEWGYYACPGMRTGRRGDFYTNVSVGPAFGEILGWAAEARWRRAGEPAVFHLVEQGAHDGQLTADLKAGLVNRGSPLASAARHWIVEPLPGRAVALRTRFGDSVQVVADLADVVAPQGLFFCNELVDALPVNVLVACNGRWCERVVGWEKDGPVWLEMELQDDSLPEVVADLGEAEPEGRVTEFCPGRKQWVQQVGRLFPEGGWWWVFDYGEPGVRGETLRCYAGHQRTQDPFQDIGRLDITSDADFGAMSEEARAAGLEVRPLQDQHDFLTREAVPWLLSIEQETSSLGHISAMLASRIRQFRTLTHPGLMGRLFKISEWRRL